VVGHLIAAEAKHIDHVDGDRISSRWNSEKRAVVGPGERLAGDNPIILCHLIVDDDPKVRESRL